MVSSRRETFDMRKDYIGVIQSDYASIGSGQIQPSVCISNGIWAGRLLVHGSPRDVKYCHPNWFRLAPNGTNLGLFKTSFSHGAKMY